MKNPDTEHDPALAPDKTDAPASGVQSDVTEGKYTARNEPPHRVIKRRTKTGCLTCRQRRIKCGEEKPVCHNCIKSRRECKGYAQRVVFKDPVGINAAFDSSFPASNNAQVQQSPSTGISLPNGYRNCFSLQEQALSNSTNVLARQSSVIGMTGNPADGNKTSSTGPLQYLPAQISHASQSSARQTPDLTQPALVPVPAFSQPFQRFSTASWTSDPHSSPESSSGLGLPTQEHASCPSGHVESNPPVSTVVPRGSAYSTARLPLNLPVSQPLEPQSWNPNAGHILKQHSSYYPRTHNLPDPATKAPYFNEYGDGHYGPTANGKLVNDTLRDSSIMPTANRSELSLQSLAAHLNGRNILASYRPTLDSTPLNDPKAAKIFVHFIHSIGPFLSVFERHPVDFPIVLGASVPAAQQGLWTYTLPFEALEHQALLQAMLAISSLHISFLQQAPQTISLKHYHYALKRVGSAVGLPTRRSQYGTLAATLLLGYYEVVAADHTKWNSHVAGSAQLVREIDYAGLTRDLRAHRRRMQAQRGHMAPDLWLGNSPHAVLEDDPFAEKEESIDENLIGTIFGGTVDYDEYGQVENDSDQPCLKHFTQKDIENFRIQCDLYWWYCKQDTIQSIISGNQLFMPYYQWAQCPPRAGMGRLDAVYGSADHLWLLLGRLTDFGYRDRKRKLKAAKASGVDWKPNLGFFKFMARFAGGSSKMRGPPPPGPSGPTQDTRGSHSSPSSGNNSSPLKEQSPPMYGMVPQRRPVQLPSAFQNNTLHSMDPPGQDNDDENATYSDAEDEWEHILAAFDAFAHAFGYDFMPLPDTIPPTSTPFGQALRYRTQPIAVLWGFYYTGRILLLRLHPSMPPAMMVAASVAAPATAAYAQTIGRIAAGVYDPQLLNIGPDRLRPTQCSYLVEMTVPIFFAAVQYTDPGQRQWTIVNLRNVSRLTGWKSSDAIASGCERSWVVAGKQETGPPYQPTGEARQQPTTDPSPQQRADDYFGPYHNTER